jgi:hypothetical protein
MPNQHAVVLGRQHVHRGDVQLLGGVDLAEQRQRPGADVQDVHLVAGQRIHEPAVVRRERRLRVEPLTVLVAPAVALGAQVALPEAALVGQARLPAAREPEDGPQGALEERFQAVVHV